jgi:hypothetical protein
VNTTVANPRTPPYATILDSGATNHIFKESDSSAFLDRSDDRSQTVGTPTGQEIRSIAKAFINHPGIPRAATEVMIFADKDLPVYNLISVPQLCMAGMTATFHGGGATINNAAGDNIITAVWNNRSGLYEIEQDINFAGVMFPKSSSQDQKAKFFIAAMGSPTTDTLVSAMEKGYVNFPGLETRAVRKMPHSEATARGHLDRTRAGLDSTTEQASTDTPTKAVHVSVSKERGLIFADMTGRFPIPSLRGAEYIMVMKCSDTGFIHVESMRTRSSKDMVLAMESGITFFRDCGIVHEAIRTDNETSGNLKETLRKLNIRPEYVAPHNHRQNPAERDIRTFKNHFIATLCTTDQDFPLSEWDLLLPVAEMTLNLLRPSLRDPKKSAWSDLKGPYNFNRNPIAPAGTRVTVHEDANSRSTWDPHGVRGYYLGPAMEHYRCHRVLVEKTKRIRISDSLTWHPEPKITTDDVQLIVNGPLGAIEQHNAKNPKRRKKKENLPPVPRGFDNPVQCEAQMPQQLNVSPRLEDMRVTAVEERSTETTTQLPAESIRTSLRRKKRNPRYDQHHYAGLTYKKACKGPDRIVWEKAACEEFHRLIVETATMKIIKFEEMEDGRKPSYYNPQTRIKVKSDGSKEFRVRGTYGGNISDYLGPKSAMTADMVSIKLLLNAVLAKKGRRFMTLDIKDFYLGTPMDRKEYMKIAVDQFPEEARAQFINPGMVKNGHVLVEINKGIYGLAQAGRLAQDRLVALLEDNGYRPISPLNPCIFKHENRDVTFSLVVDDFGVMYERKEDVCHLLETLREIYTVKEDWTGSSYVGYNIVHDIDKATITLSMPGYIDAAKQRFQVDTNPHTDNPYDDKAEADTEDSTLATEAQKKRVQQIIGVLLYYARAVDPTLLVRINKIASKISSATTNTMDAAERVLRYAISNPDASCTYHKSEMTLIVYSDASYLTEIESRSRCGGFFFLGNKGEDWKLNGPVMCNSRIIDVVVSSAAESEYAAAYMNAKEAASMRETLEALGYKQPATPIISDNSFICNLMSGEYKSKKIKAMDMRFEWLRERALRGQYIMKWNERALNIADYFTKDLSNDDYKRMRKFVMPDRNSRVTSLDIANASGGGQFGRGSKILDGSIVKNSWKEDCDREINVLS